MKTANFNDTVDILVKAYFNNTLEHGNYCACAVGNIIAHSCGIRLIAPKEREKYGSRIVWEGKYSGEEWYDNKGQLGKEGIFLISQTGYSINEIFRIEKAFESKRRYGHEAEAEFNGLMAVVSVLAEIHGISLDETEKARKLFNKIPA